MDIELQYKKGIWGIKSRNKEQMLCGLKTRLKAAKEYGYSFKFIVSVLKTILVLCIPLKILSI